LAITEFLLIKEGLANRVGHRRENSQQIAALSDPVDHLLAKEGIDDQRLTVNGTNGLNKPAFRASTPAKERLAIWGQVLGTHRAGP
jgi:hypothetical protein